MALTFWPSTKTIRLPQDGDSLYEVENRPVGKNFDFDKDAESADFSSVPQAVGGAQAVSSAVKVALRELGAISTFKTLSKVNQKWGIDCPGCAWPESEHDRSMAEFCENGAKALAEEATRKRVDQGFFRRYPLSDLREMSEYQLSQQGRLSQPVIRRKGSEWFEPISWDEVTGLIGEFLRETDPKRCVFYTSGRTSNEAAFLYQLFVRMHGSNNLPDCSNLCHESSGVALRETLGSGKGTVLLEDFEKADVIFVIGQNPATNHPRMLTTLQKAARRGSAIVAVNPMAEPGLFRFKNPQEIGGWLGGGTGLATHFLRVKINGDLALFKGIIKGILELGGWGGHSSSTVTGLDWSFIETSTEGFAALLEEVRQCSWEDLCGESGLSQQEILGVSKLVREAKGVICCWAMGLTQHYNAVATIQEVVNLLLMTGHLGKPGSGLCPVRGHSNVQGDRTMGIWEAPPPDFLNRLGREFSFVPPREPGYHVVSAIQAMEMGKVDYFMALGGNFLSAAPDTAYTEKALEKVRLAVHVSTKLNKSHLVLNETTLILPCLGRTDRDKQQGGLQWVSVEDSMGMVHPSKGVLKPPSEECLSEVMIVCRLAQASLGHRYPLPWMSYGDNYDLIRSHIEKVIPGFEGFQEALLQKGMHLLPHLVRDQRKFATVSGRAQFTVNPLYPEGHDEMRPRLQPDQFLLMTVRSHDQYNTTIYGLSDRYRGIAKGRRVIFIHPDDIKEQGFVPYDWVDVTSHFKGQKRQVSKFQLVPFDIARKCLAAYFPETNPLVPIESYAARSHTPTSKSIVVSLSRMTLAKPSIKAPL